MKSVIVAAALPLFLWSGACAEKAQPGQCSLSCDHVAAIRLAPLKKQKQAALHELDENVDRNEDAAKANAATLRQQMAVGDPQWSEKALAKLSPVKRRAAIERHDWEQNQLRVQRELALKRDDESVSSARKTYEDAKVKADEDLKKVTADTVKACVDQCLKGTAKHADCLRRTQAVEDLDICDRGKLVTDPITRLFAAFPARRQEPVRVGG